MYLLLEFTFVFTGNELMTTNNNEKECLYFNFKDSPIAIISFKINYVADNVLNFYQYSCVGFV